MNRNKQDQKPLGNKPFGTSPTRSKTLGTGSPARFSEVRVRQSFVLLRLFVGGFLLFQGLEGLNHLSSPELFTQNLNTIATSHPWPWLQTFITTTLIPSTQTTLTWVSLMSFMVGLTLVSGLFVQASLPIAFLFYGGALVLNGYQSWEASAFYLSGLAMTMALYWSQSAMAYGLDEKLFSTHKTTGSLLERLKKTVQDQKAKVTVGSSKNNASKTADKNKKSPKAASTPSKKKGK